MKELRYSMSVPREAEQYAEMISNLQRHCANFTTCISGCYYLITIK